MQTGSENPSAHSTYVTEHIHEPLSPWRIHPATSIHRSYVGLMLSGNNCGELAMVSSVPGLVLHTSWYDNDNEQDDYANNQAHPHLHICQDVSSTSTSQKQGFGIPFHHICLRTLLAPRRKPCADTARLSVLSWRESRRSPRWETLLMFSRITPTVSSICCRRALVSTYPEKLTVRHSKNHDGRECQER